MIINTRTINVDTNASSDEAYVSVINITPNIHKLVTVEYITNEASTGMLTGDIARDDEM